MPTQGLLMVDLITVVVVGSGKYFLKKSMAKRKKF